MPIRSESQRGLMYAAAAGKKWATSKVSPEVAKEFVSTDKPGKLPEHAASSKDERAAKRYGAR